MPKSSSRTKLQKASTSSKKAEGQPGRDYKSFLESLNLYSLALVRSLVRANRREYLRAEETSLQATLACKPTRIAREHFDLLATLRLKMSLPGDRRTLVRIVATYELHFHSTDPVRQDFVHRLSESEVRFIIWPFFREFVSSTSSRMHIPPIVLPVSGLGQQPGTMEHLDE